MSAKILIEDLLTAEIPTLLPAFYLEHTGEARELGVPVLPGRAGSEGRPPSFVLVDVKDEEPAGDRGWKVPVQLVSVAQLDDVGELEASKGRIGMLATFFGAKCPFRRMRRPGLYIAGITLQGTTSFDKTRSRGEILTMTFLVTVAG